MRLTEEEYEKLTSRRAAARNDESSEGATAARQRREQSPIRQSTKGPNKTERRFEIERLDPWKRDGAIYDYQFEAVKLRLANGVSYTPDYLVSVAHDMPQFFEVKGGYMREDASIKLKVAAAQYECFEFYLAQYKGGAWTITRVYP